MALRYKIDVMKELKEKGYSSTRIREEKLIGQSYLQQIRHHGRRNTHLAQNDAGHDGKEDHNERACETA